MAKREVTREEHFYDKSAGNLLYELKAQTGLTYKQLARRLEEVGIDIGAQALNNKLKRMTYSFGFAMHVMAALDIRSIDVPQLPPDCFSLPVTRGTLQRDTYRVPPRFKKLFDRSIHVRNVDGTRWGRLRISEEGFLRGLNSIFEPHASGQVFDVDVRSDHLVVSLRDSNGEPEEEKRCRWVIDPSRSCARPSCAKLMRTALDLRTPMP